VLLQTLRDEVRARLQALAAHGHPRRTSFELVQWLLTADDCSVTDRGQLRRIPRSVTSAATRVHTRAFTATATADGVTVPQKETLSGVAWFNYNDDPSALRDKHVKDWAQLYVDQEESAADDGDADTETDVSELDQAEDSDDSVSASDVEHDEGDADHGTEAARGSESSRDSEGTVDLYAAHPVGVYPECGNTSPNAVLMLKKAKLWNRQDFTALLQHRGAYTVTSLSKLRRVKRVLDNLCSLIVGVRCVVCNRLQLRMLTVLPFYYRSTCRTGWLGSCCAQGVCRVADKW
jgi:hypothetical protein